MFVATELQKNRWILVGPSRDLPGIFHEIFGPEFSTPSANQFWHILRAKNMKCGQSRRGLGIFPLARRGMGPRPHRALKKYLGSDTLGPLAMPWFLKKKIFCHSVGRFLGAKMMKKCRVLFFTTGLPDASRIIPGVSQVLPGTPG